MGATVCLWQPVGLSGVPAYAFIPPFWWFRLRSTTATSELPLRAAPTIPCAGAIFKLYEGFRKHLILYRGTSAEHIVHMHW